MDLVCSSWCFTGFKWVLGYNLYIQVPYYSRQYFLKFRRRSRNGHSLLTSRELQGRHQIWWKGKLFCLLPFEKCIVPRGYNERWNTQFVCRERQSNSWTYLPWYVVVCRFGVCLTNPHSTNIFYHLILPCGVIVTPDHSTLHIILDIIYLTSYEC